MVGPGADLVREVMKRAGLQSDVKIYPWPRAYALAQTQANVLIFSLGRTPEREMKFKWVGEILNARFRFIKLKSRTDIALKTLDDARQYSIGVTNEDITHQFLIKKGFPAGHLDLASDTDMNINKLLAGRMDLMMGSASNVSSLCTHDPTICDRTETALMVDEMNTSLYMAFSNATSDEIVERVRKAYGSIRADGTYERIMRAVR